MEKLNIKRTLSVNYVEDIITISKHRDNMLELEKISYGHELEAIQMEVFDCRRFLANARRHRNYEKLKKYLR